MKPILEQINLNHEASIHAFHHAKKNFETPWHFHPQHELTYIQESIGTKFIGDYVGGYEPGELVLLRSNLPHCWKNYTTQEGSSKSTVVQWNKGIFAKVPELSGLFHLLKVASKGILFKNREVAPLIPLLLELPQLSGQTLYIQLLSLLSQLADCEFQTLSESSFLEDLPSAYSSRMAKIHAFVEAHYARKVYLKELADLVNLSEQAFSDLLVK